MTPSTLYSGTYGSGVYKSTDDGSSWNAANAGLPIRKDFDGWTIFNELPGRAALVWALAVDPKTPSVLYAGTGNLNPNDAPGGVYKSTDGGSSWNAANAGLTIWAVLALAIDPRTASTVYAGTYDSSGGGIYKSTDGGGSWSAANAGLRAFRPPEVPLVPIYALAIDPVTPSTVYAGARGYMYKSTNGGSSWTEINPPLSAQVSSFYAFAIDPIMPGTVYAGNLTSSPPYTTGVWKSTDGGGSWTPMNAGLPALAVYTLAMDPKAPGTLYAGNGTIYKSTDGGSSWGAVNTGLTNHLILALAIDPAAAGRLYAGTNGSGVFVGVPCVGGVGDCDRNGKVAIDEILTMVNIALGNADLPACEAADANHDGQVTIDEILTAVNSALNGCVQ